jgi:hypothetical protein
MYRSTATGRSVTRSARPSGPPASRHLRRARPGRPRTRSGATALAATTVAMSTQSFGRSKRALNRTSSTGPSTRIRRPAKGTVRLRAPPCVQGCVVQEQVDRRVVRDRPSEGVRQTGCCQGLGQGEDLLDQRRHDGTRGKRSPPSRRNGRASARCSTSSRRRARRSSAAWSGSAGTSSVPAAHSSRSRVATVGCLRPDSMAATADCDVPAASARARWLRPA